MVLVGGGCIHFKVHGFLMRHLKSYLERRETFLLVYVCMLVLVLGR